MIDIHTHVLPGIDDGSKSIEETSEMLSCMASSGVKCVVATPHYYHNISIEEFLSKRDAACSFVAELETKPQIRLGAEVWLEYGMHSIPDLKKLCIQGTDYMIVELPYAKWDNWVYDEIFKISLKNINVIIAHIDRYMHIEEEKSVYRLLDLGIKFQGNVDMMGSFIRKSPVEKLMKKGVIHFVGTDCHNMTTRKPCMDTAVKRISNLFGNQYVESLMTNAEKMLNNQIV